MWQCDFQAVLYDEKGGRLDSIYIKISDIVVGEQLESDRYYILVEEEKGRAHSSNSQPKGIHLIDWYKLNPAWFAF